jgi:hypothetical protein
MKLGEVLVQKGLITKSQLKEALEAQLIFGGHLGTCLMELGFVTERLLGNVLAESLGVGYAPPEFFENIPRYVTSSLTDRLVDKHQVVPFRLQDRLLDIAMVDPKDLGAQDEISFAAGYKLRTWVAPEARVFQAMERYYDIPRRLRYVTLCREIDRHTEIEMLGAGFRPAAESAPERPGVPVSSLVGDAAAGFSVIPQPSGARQTATAVAEPPQEEGDPLAPLSWQLMHADTVDRVTEIALDHASREVDRCLVMMVRAGKALPWQAAGIPADPSRWSSLSFVVTGEPIFGLLNGEDLYRGPIPRQLAYRQFYDALEIEMPEEALLVSAHVDDRLVAIFYGDGGPSGKVRGEDDHYRRIVRKLGLALNMVQLRRSILNA